MVVEGGLGSGVLEKEIQTVIWRARVNTRVDQDACFVLPGEGDHLYQVSIFQDSVMGGWTVEVVEAAGEVSTSGPVNQGS